MAVRRVAARPSSPTSPRFDADVDRLTTAITRGGDLDPPLKRSASRMRVAPNSVSR